LLQKSPIKECVERKKGNKSIKKQVLIFWYCRFICFYNVVIFFGVKIEPRLFIVLNYPKYLKTHISCWNEGNVKRSAVLPLRRFCVLLIDWLE
jgi:hypothetical protein